MQPDRSVLFDLDDTLCPLEQFRLSGFSAVAAHLEKAAGLDRRDVLETLTRAAAGAGRGRELQAVAAAHALPASIVGPLVQVMRDHTPAIRLSDEARRTLETLRRDWRIGVVTNGLPAVQRSKVRALGLADVVDAIVYAAEEGSRRGKPERAPFLAAARQLGSPIDRTVFVGDDPWCDMFGASRVGMRTVLMAPVAPAAPARYADAVVGSLFEVPPAAELMVPVRRSSVRDRQGDPVKCTSSIHSVTAGESA